MSLKKLNHQGFTAVEGLLVVLIIAVLGGVGYYVYHSNKTDDDTKDTTAKTSQSATSSTSAQAPAATPAFTIKEWGVKAALTSEVGLNYTITTDNAGLTYAHFSSNKLDAADPACKAKGYGGNVTRYKSSDHYLMGDGEVDSGKTAAQTAAQLNAGEYGHVGDYYYFYVSPQGQCAEAAQGLQTQTMDAVKALVPKLEAVPAS